MGQCAGKSYYVTGSIVGLPDYIQSQQLQSLSKPQTGNEKVAATATSEGFLGLLEVRRNLEQVCVLSASQIKRECYCASW